MSAAKSDSDRATRDQPSSAPGDEAAPVALSECRAAPQACEQAAANALYCPRCGYDLRGTSEPRCPECGLQFAWEELSQRAEVAWLYETARGRLALRAWAGTLRRSLRPKRFWGSIPLTVEPVPGRLVLYAFLTLLLGLALTCLVLDALYDAWNAWHSTDPWSRIGKLLWETLWGWMTDPLDSLPPWPLLLAPASYAIATGLGLVICARSLGRMRIRPVHLLRMVAYATCVVMLWPLGVVIAIVGGWCIHLPQAWRFSVGTAMLCSSMFILMLAYAYFLQCAMSQYARFEQTRSIVWASQIIAALTALDILIAGMLMLYF